MAPIRTKLKGIRIMYGMGRLKAMPVFSAYPSDNQEVMFNGVCRCVTATHLVIWSMMATSRESAPMKIADFEEYGIDKLVKVYELMYDLRPPGTDEHFMKLCMRTLKLYIFVLPSTF